MGWYYGCASKEQVIRELNVLSADFHLVKSSTVGNNHWQLVMRKSDGLQFIALALLSCHKGDWGYKPMDESFHPYQYNCPLSWLDMVGEPINDMSREWREKVRQYHAAKKRKKAALVPGTIVRYGDSEFRLDHNVGRKGWFVTRLDGVKFRMKCKQINSATVVTA